MKLMKLWKILLGICLSALISLLPANPSLAESLCPLPKELKGLAVTFLNSKCQEVKLTEPQTFYRYYSNNGAHGNKYGRFLTTDRYDKSSEAIRKLALNQEWGNKATMREKIILPAGMIVYQGLAAPQQPQKCYPGKGEQTLIENSHTPGIKWIFDQELEQASPFVCPQDSKG